MRPHSPNFCYPLKMETTASDGFGLVRDCPPMVAFDPKLPIAFPGSSRSSVAS
jgi:hypothetical protein